MLPITVKLACVATSLLVSFNALAQEYVPTPVMPDKLKVISQHTNSPKQEAVDRLVDGDHQSKFLVFDNHSQIIFQLDHQQTLTGYQLTSANDAPKRDPEQWILEGSLDGNKWNIIDQQNQQIFENRHQKVLYPLSNNGAYNFYRLSFSHDNTSQYGDNYLQLAEVTFYSNNKRPITSFGSSHQQAAVNDVIQFWDHSKNHPTSWQWYFEGGQPSTSSDKNPKVSFASSGAHKVSLVTSNSFGQDKKTISRMVKVLDVNQPWQGFEFPTVELQHEDTTSEGYQRLTSLMPDIERVIHEISLEVNKRLYKNYTQSPNFDRIVFSLQWSDVLASRGGSGDTMLLTFSTKYVAERLKDKSDEEVLYELEGVFWHELTHGYQYHVDSGQYTDGTGYHAFIEGMADLIRIDAGYHKTRKPKPSDTWLGGYTNTGFFLHWLSKNYQADFAFLFNQSVKDLPNWTFEKAIESIIGEPIEQLWRKYQTELKQQD
ncbi:MAG: basic secretory protein-like protein [Cognaticolwellia aestuarii]